MNQRFGATGKFPDGTLGPNDEGELMLGISDMDSRGLIHFNFGKDVSWFALPAESAINLARMILKKVGATKVEITFSATENPDEALRRRETKGRG